MTFIIVLLVLTGGIDAILFKHHTIVANTTPVDEVAVRTGLTTDQQYNPPNFYPPELHKVYNFPKTSHRPNIAIIELCDHTNPCGYLRSDIETYWDLLNEDIWPHLGFESTTKRPNIYEVFVYDQMSLMSGVNMPGFANNDLEVILDIELTTGLFPGFNVDVTIYFAPNTIQGFYNGFKWAIDSGNHSVISVSWGSPEYYASDSPGINFIYGEDDTLVSYFDAMKSLIHRASKEGISVFASTGDYGASDGMLTTLNVDFPASTPYMIACGGTILELDQYSYGSPVEEVWDDVYGATGGGYSQFFKPAWFQKEALKETPMREKSYRGVPDVSSVASPETGILIYTSEEFFGGFIIVGGTSAASPLWAALWATVTDGRRVYAGDVIYSPCAVDGFRDVTVGNNKYYDATTGYDLCTGMGTPRGDQLRHVIRELEKSGRLCGGKHEEYRENVWREERLDELIPQWREERKHANHFN